MNPSPTIPSFKVLNPAADVVFGAGKVDWQLPWDYFWSTTLTTETKMDITLSSCPDPMEDGTITDGAGAPKPTGELPGTTADGFAFSGSYPSPSGSETWSLTGTPTS
jgi:hypothetical protein